MLQDRRTTPRRFVNSAAKMRFDGSLLAQPHWPLSILATYVMLAIAAVIGTVVAGWSWFFAGRCAGRRDGCVRAAAHGLRLYLRTQSRIRGIEQAKRPRVGGTRRACVTAFNECFAQPVAHPRLNRISPVFGRYLLEISARAREVP